MCRKNKNTYLIIFAVILEILGIVFPLLLFPCLRSCVSLGILLCHTVDVSGFVPLAQHDGIGRPHHTEPHHNEHQSDTKPGSGLLHSLNTAQGEIIITHNM